MRGYFYLDDLAFTGRSADYPLWSLRYLTTPYNSHLMPGSFAWVWLTTRAFPLQWAPVAVVLIALQVLLSVLVYRLLVELFGRRPAILPPLAVALLSPVSLPAFVWWAAALNQLPQQIATVGALLLHVRYLRTGRRALALAGPLVLAGGLLFSEKTLFVVPLVLAITLVFFVDGSVWARVRRTVRRDLVVWAAYCVVSLPYLVYYVLSVPSPIRPAAAGHDIADLTTQSVFRATVPGLLGGPWHWTRIGSAGALADPDAFLVVVSFLVAGAVVTGSIVLWHRASHAWLILLGYVVLDLTLLARSRATLVGPVVGTEYRYQTDVAVVAALCVGLATTPLTGVLGRGDVQRLQPRVAAREWLTIHVLVPLREAGAAPRTTHHLARGAAVATTVLLVASALWSTAAYDPLWVHNPAHSYLTAARTAVASLPAGAVVADVAVPNDVAWPLLYPYNRTYRLFGPFLPASRRLAVGATTTDLVVPDDAGTPRVATILGPHALPGPTPGCGWLLGQDPVHIPLNTTATDTVAVVRIGYQARAATLLTLRLDGHPVQVPFAAGTGIVFLAAAGPFDSIQVDAPGTPAHVCTTDLTAGVPVAVAGTTP